jgi:hypothetical protein
MQSTIICFAVHFESKVEKIKTSDGRVVWQAAVKFGELLKRSQQAKALAVVKRPKALDCPLCAGSNVWDWVRASSAEAN